MYYNGEGLSSGEVAQSFTQLIAKRLRIGSKLGLERKPFHSIWRQTGATTGYQLDWHLKGEYNGGDKFLCQLSSW